MAIRKIPNNTEWFHYHNENPKDNRAADCVFRAIGFATGNGWDKAYDSLCEMGRKLKRAPNEKATYEKWLAANGWVKHKQPKKWNGTKFTVQEFLEDYFTDGRTVIISVANHLTVAYDHQLYDTWDCSYKCVGNYWASE